jgi:hypothetical protein
MTQTMYACEEINKIKRVFKKVYSIPIKDIRGRIYVT